MKKVTCIYCIFIGICMLGMWTMLLVTGQVKELSTEPYSIAGHLTAEFVTASLLIVGAVGVLQKKAWGNIIQIVSLGALLYSVIAACGYYLQDGSIPMIAMFASFIVLTSFFLLAIVKGSRKISV